MALQKVTYVDGETVISASNLNAIQDEILRHESVIETLETGVTMDEVNDAIETAIGDAIGGSY